MYLIDTPLYVGTLQLHNRLVLPPMASGKPDEAGHVTDGMLRYYAEKSQGGCLALVIAEHAYVSLQGRAHKNQLSIASDETIPGLARLASVVHQNGGKIFAQISHAGGAAKPDETGLPVLAPSSCAEGRVQAEREAAPEELRLVARQFADAAVRAQEAGFDGVEIHSAHGYLLNQFYSPLTNRRTDGYGGEVQGRIRLHREVIRAVREAVGPDYPLSLRLGVYDDCPGGNGMEQAVAAGRALCAEKIDLLSVTGGMTGYLVKGREGQQGHFQDISAALKQAVDTPILLTGGITEIQAAEALLESGKADLIGVGRAMLRNSHWAEQALRELHHGPEGEVTTGKHGSKQNFAV